jgi:hypothetical protein
MAAIIIGYKTRSPVTLPLMFDVNVAGEPAPPLVVLLTIFVNVVVAAAVPVVASPALVLLVTLALPDVEVAPRVLPIVLVVAAFVVLLVIAVLFVLFVGVVTGAEDDVVGAVAVGLVGGITAPAGGVAEVVTTG